MSIGRHRPVNETQIHEAQKDERQPLHGRIASALVRTAKSLTKLAVPKLIVREKLVENGRSVLARDRYQRGSLRPMRYSQPLPGTLLAQNQHCRGMYISTALRKKLEPYLSKRPKRGMGYIIEKGDELDELALEAYDAHESFEEEGALDDVIEKLLEYNCHLGMNEVKALEDAVGCLLFFPELEELWNGKHQEFPAIEAFLALSGWPPAWATSLHWVPNRFPANDSNLTTMGRPYRFEKDGFKASQAHDPVRSDVPEIWVRENVEPEMHNARVNSDKPYNRTLLILGRYTSFLRG
jgi:hypothetical protein